MPGRQSTGPSVQKKPKVKIQSKKRALNALAIAEQQDPGKAQVRQHRLGEIDQGEDKRRRDVLQEELEDEEGGRSQTKRRRLGQRDRFGDEIEGGTDSEGNEWVLGHVGSNDDSDLDSDEALGESDEDRFEGFTFRGSSALNTRGRPRGSLQISASGTRSPHEVDLNEHDDENHGLDEESDDFKEDAVDLAAMLDDSDSERLTDTANGNKPYSRFDDEISNASSEDSSDRLGSDLSVSDIEDDANNATKLSALQNFVSSMDNSQHAFKNGSNPLRDAQEASTPSEFGLNPRQKLTVKDLLPTVTDPQLKQSLKLLAEDDTKQHKSGNGIPQKLEVPLAKRQQDRLDRSAAYEKSKETLNRWIDTVKHNRRAEHLSFPILDPNAVAAKGSARLLPITYSKPLTSLESTIQDILVDSGLATSNGKSQEDKLIEFEELQTNKLPIEEVQARRAELRKARELLFREEIRAKRIKKIKSKSYRRVHRRERERDARQMAEAFTASYNDLSDDEQERNDRQRAEERMGARHRESKWAKGVKDSGRAAWDEDARSGVTEMARREEELRRRIEGRDVNAEDDDFLSSGSETEISDEDGDSTGSNNGGHNQRLREKLQQLNGNEKIDAAGLSSRTTLSSMKFMQIAERNQKEQNDADVETLRRVLAGEETSDESQAGEAPGRRTYGVKKDQTHTSRKLPMKVNELEEGSASENEETIDPTTSAGDGVEATIDEAKAPKKTIPSRGPLLQTKTNKSSKRKEPTSPPENPWLSTKTPNNKHRNPRTFDNAVLISNAPSNPTPEILSAHLPNVASQFPNSPTFSGFSSDSDSKNSQPLPLSNRDLIRQAFAGDEVVANFEAEKAAATLDEEEKVISTSLPGWGSWTGTGISKKEAKRNVKTTKGREVVKIEGIKKEKRVDWGLEKVVVSEKRVKKNSKYLASSLPHPFETRQQYERSLRLPVGPEWTTKETFQAATKPRVLMKQGVIAPMERPLL